MTRTKGAQWPKQKAPIIARLKAPTTQEDKGAGSAASTEGARIENVGCQDRRRRVTRAEGVSTSCQDRRYRVARTKGALWPGQKAPDDQDRTKRAWWSEKKAPDG